MMKTRRVDVSADTQKESSSDNNEVNSTLAIKTFALRTWAGNRAR